MKIFVTGGTGFLGSHFLESLSKRLGPDDEVFALARSPLASTDPRIKFISGDLRRVEEARSYLLESDYVFHLGGEARFRNDLDYEGSNIIPTVKMVEILRESRVLKNFIFTSTIGACDRAPNDKVNAPLKVSSHPAPTSEYGRSKLKCEEAIRSAGIPFTIIRPTWIYGKGMRLDSHVNAFVGMLLKLPFMARFHFPGMVSVIHVDDMSQALVNAIDNPAILGKTYFAVTENLSLGSMMNQISGKLTGKRVPQIPIPSFHSVFSRVHRKLPLALSNLFINYLCAEDASFAADFDLNNPVRFDYGISEVVASNPLARGYYLITGANSGIGLALANNLKAQGKRLILVDKAVSNIEKNFPNEITIQGDLASKETISAIVGTVTRLPLRCVMNVAGVGFKGSFLETPIEKSTATIDVNIGGPLSLIHALRKKLIADKSDIVNVASSVAYYPLPGMSVYAASKAFLANWSEALAVELKPTNRVFTISPGGTKTSFQKSAGVAETQDLLAPEDVAQRILNNLNGKPKTYVYGMRSKVLATGARLLSPRRMSSIMGKLFQEAR